MPASCLEEKGGLQAAGWSWQFSVVKAIADLILSPFCVKQVLDCGFSVSKLPNYLAADYIGEGSSIMPTELFHFAYTTVTQRERQRNSQINLKTYAQVNHL